MKQHLWKPWFSKFLGFLPITVLKYQKQPSRGVLRQRCYENIQQIYWSAEVSLMHGHSSVNLLHIFRTPFPKNTSARLLLWLFWEIFFLKKKSEIWAKYRQWHYGFKFLEGIWLPWLSHVGFGEMRFLKWRDVINSNSCFLAKLNGLCE